MITFHTTDAEEVILAEGFRDGEDSYGLATTTLRGVWLSNEPVDESTRIIRVALSRTSAQALAGRRRCCGEEG